MDIVIKYVVMEDKHVDWIIQTAKEQYGKLYVDSSKQLEMNTYFDNNFQKKKLIFSQNDFTKQTIIILPKFRTAS